MTAPAAKPLSPENLARDFGASSPPVRHAPGVNLVDQQALRTYYALLIEQLVERIAPGKGESIAADLPLFQPGERKSDGFARLRDGICRVLDDYALDLAALAASGPRDFFKLLYCSLFSQSQRRRLGEFYTPDWLANHLLEQLDYDGDPTETLLDPACGSGTFLIAALRRMLKKVASGQWPVVREGRGESENPKPKAQDSRQKFPIVGFDLNPLAVLSTRANLLLAAAQFFYGAKDFSIPIHLRDSILDGGESPAAGKFDFVVGNPPWIAWDKLPAELRRATAPLWRRYGLFSLSGNQARHGGGKKDLAMLMLYAAADKHLADGGRLGMVITQTVFQTLGAGDGFRRFRIGEDGPPLKILRVDDMSAIHPFDGAAVRAATLVLKKGEETVYPVPYFLWDVGRGAGGGRLAGDRSMLRPENDVCSSKRGPKNGPVSLVSPSIHQTPCLARPVDPSKPTSPWLVIDNNAQCIKSNHNNRRRTSGEPSCRSDYQAHLGVNSGGANGVFWVEILQRSREHVLIRNLPSRGKHPIELVEQAIEPDLLYPLLRWGDVRRYRAVPQCCVIIAQDPAARTGIAPAVMREKFPLTLAYLERFRESLLRRAAYRRYQGRGPFYSMYNVGPYSLAPIKVVWRRMDRQLSAAVVEPPTENGNINSPLSLWERARVRAVDGESGVLHLCASDTFSPLSPLPKGEGTNMQKSHYQQDEFSRRPALPQETCCLAVCQSSDEAHYLCALLNSAELNKRAARQGIRGGKGFGSPGMIAHLPLPRFDAADRRHLALADLSRQAHAAAAEENESLLAALQRRMDRLAAGG